jgi:hypothetical protein
MRDGGAIMFLAVVMVWGVVVLWKEILIAILVFSVAIMLYGLVSLLSVLPR